MQVEIGQRFGRYSLVREIGRGGLGTVYLAEDANLSRQVALKVLHSILATNESFIARFKHEAETLARLDHPGVLRIHAFEQIEGQWCIEMPFYPGGSLLDRMGRRPLALHEVMFTIRDLLEALSYCHAACVVHRDLKPANALLSSSGNLVIGDFGLAAALNHDFGQSIETGSTSGCFIGTPRYAPPEAWEEGEPCPSWDVYSTGLILYELLTGKYPYAARSPLSILKEMMTVGLPPVTTSRPELSDSLNSVVQRMMASTPSERYQDAAQALDAFMHTPESMDLGYDAAVTHVPVSQILKRKQPRRSRRRMLQAVAALCILAGGAFAIYLNYPRAALDGEEEASQVVADEDGQEFIRSQVDMARIGLVGEDEFLDLWKYGLGVSRVLDTFTAETGIRHKNHWLSRLHSDESSREVLAATSKKLWYMTAREEEGLIHFSGHWAHYEGPDNEFHTGKVQGQGVRISPDNYRVQLVFTEEDGTSFTQTLMTVRSEKQTCTRFLWEAENANELMPLLYNEVLARDLTWGEAVESFFPCVADGRAHVRYVPNDVEDILIDGRLAEATWQIPALFPREPASVLEGRPGVRKPELHLRYTKEGLYLGIRSFLLLDPSGIEMDIVILSQYTIPAWNSERWTYTWRGPASPRAAHIVAGEYLPWESAWQIEGVEHEDMWQAEAFLPFDSLGINGMPPEGARWRLNVCVREPARMPRAGEDVMRWGFPNISRVEHGAIIVFGPRDSERHEPA